LHRVLARKHKTRDKKDRPRSINAKRSISRARTDSSKIFLLRPVAAAYCLLPGATIDLAGFSITGTSSQSTNNGGIIAAPPGGPGVAVRNGTISGFNLAVQLLGGSIVEGLRILCGPASTGISAQGIVRDNTVSECQPGITADQGSTVTGNTVIGGITGDGIVVNQGSTVIGNSVTNNSVGIDANCPSNLTNNTVLNNPGGNIVLNGTGCNNTNNVAP
jgi:hypothetical protein